MPIALEVLGEEKFGETDRPDNWWVKPAVIAAYLIFAIIYGTIRAFMGKFYDAGSGPVHHSDWGSENASYLLSPFYSPLITVFRDMFSGAIPWPWMIIFLSPALVILPIPMGFRVTCYYYRKAYYRSFFGTPPACGVRGVGKEGSYKGENKLLLWQNLHRYFMYLAVAYLFVLAYDFIITLYFPKDGGGWELGLSLGSLVLLMNLVLLGMYTLSCHSFRHLIGGSVKNWSTAPLGAVRYRCWTACSGINKKHGLFAMTSLFWVSFTDFYVWMVAAGAFGDYRFPDVVAYSFVVLLVLGLVAIVIKVWRDTNPEAAHA